ncbi:MULTISPECIES: RNA-binding S4 domain-containing protein [Rhodanobacter]|uniref:RNA-binding S4 domain-containing protein n=1 Tax=Rhodanobacter TaxID=75309 RepID=UPI0004859E47|nr:MULTISPECIES: RNA-binding S4 domain-containing protein [Rhodanobacter]KZC18623.1 RNA-binding protein [Rhodanobacter denitrificans]UJJ49914.1 RNA-binding S4 domain-containing protein [Rhodanobacter denitrificans]UJM92627.1 RNA-binding S4 domain-containing protein [Rhodanobacter denitrificans]UJM96157.1 RNA-binding S4 domain-containing protein [Rhodanobacter denitrificans]UJN21012.1 RNA-binding S4 domain-containing protein [Rhodanobacter denitrificans]
MSQVSAPPTNGVRVDVWLWAARFFKTRSLARQAIDGGRIDVNGAGCKPAKTLHAGDRLRISRGEERLEVGVLALSERRGPASVAQALYAETEASRVAREAVREQHRLVGASGPPKRPDKQARRELRRLRDRR